MATYNNIKKIKIGDNIFNLYDSGNSGGTITSVKTTAGTHSTVDISSGAVSFNVPTKTSHLTNDSGFITSYTDEKLKLTTISSSSYTTYYPILATTGGTAAREYDSDFAYTMKPGTSSTTGEARLILGNATASGTSSKQGIIYVYGSTAYYHKILGDPTAHRTLTLPNNTGTIALTSDIPTKTSDLTNDSGYITSSDIPVTDVTVGGTSILDGTVAKFTALETFTGTVGSSMQDGYLCGVYDPNNKVVTIHFACRSTSNIAITKTLFTIPTKYRPSSAVTVPMLIYTSSAFAGYQGSLSTAGILTQSWSGSARGAFGSCSYKI